MKNLLIQLVLFVLCLNVTFSEQTSLENLDFSVKCGTFSKENKNKIFDKLQGMEWKQAYAISPKGYFRIHYDTIGPNAVNIIDLDQNSIPDYVDSACAIFDNAYEIQVVQMGFQRPRTDLWDPNNTHYDVYIEDIPNSYGYTQPQGNYSINDTRSYSCITIDNNYSENDTRIDSQGNVVKRYTTTGINALKVTAVHEFHHSIQYAYRYPVDGTGNYNDCIYEMSSVCIEILIYPEIHDYFTYTNGLLGNLDKFCWGNGDATNGYPFGIWFYMLTLKYGNDIIKKYWETVDNNTYLYAAFDTILKSYNSNLKAEWNDFLNWIYHTGANAIEGKYFPMASLLRTPVPTQLMTYPSLYSCDLYPFDIRFIRFLNNSADLFILPDTIDVMPTNIDTAGAIYGERAGYYETSQFTARASETSFQNATEIFKDYWFYTYSQSPNVEHLFTTKPGGTTTSVQAVYPMPFDKSKNSFLYFPIADDIVIGEKVRLTIYDINQIEIYSASIEASIDGQRHRIIKYDPYNLETGVYTFTISYYDEIDLIGKFAIKG